MIDSIKHTEYPIINKEPNRLYYVAKDGYVYSVPMQRGGRAKIIKKVIEVDARELELLKQRITQLEGDKNA